MKKIFLIGGIILGILLFVLPLLYLHIYGSDKEKSYPQPKVTYGEFPFKLVYKLNGEEYVVEDSVVCKYIRTEYDLNRGEHYVWKYTLASNSRRDAVLLVKDGFQSVYCYVGEAEYYMGDEDGYYGATPFVPHVYVSSLIPSFPGLESLSQEEILEKYNIEIISWEFSDPIKNDFS